MWSTEKDFDLDLIIIIFYVFGVLITALLSTGSLQFAFREGKVSTIMAIYNGVMTIFPILFGGIVLKEWNTLILFQQIFLGISLIITILGIILLSMKHDQSLIETKR